MSQQPSVPLGYELIRDISSGTIAASEHELTHDPELMLVLFAELMEANRTLGLEILAQARAAQDAGLSAEEASIAGAMLPLAVIARHFKSKKIWEALSGQGNISPVAIKSQLRKQTHSDKKAFDKRIV